MTAAFVRRTGETVRTMGRVVLADPVRQGRLRLDGLPPLARQLAVIGVVVLATTLVSLLLTDLWRRGPLILVRDFEAAPNLSARGVVAFTIVTLAVAWVLILAGGALARPAVAVLVGLGFLLFNGGLAEPSAVGATRALRLLPDVVNVCFFVAPALAVALSLLRRTGRAHPLRPVLATAMAAAATAFFAANLALYVIEEREGYFAGLPRAVDAAMNELQSFLVPLFILAVGALVQLNHQIARAAATPFWGVRATVARVAVLLLILLKLRYGLLGRVDEWVTYVTERRVEAVQALAYLALLALAVWLFARIRADQGPEVSTESVLYLGALVLSAAVVVLGLVIRGSAFLALVGAEGAPRWTLDHFPSTGMVKYLVLSVFGVLLLLGVSLYVRPRRAPFDRRLGAVLIVLGAWIVPCVAIQQLSERDVGFDIGLVDLVLTLVALVYLLARWRRLDTAAAVRVGALLLFMSLVAGNGYVATRLVSRALAFFTPPAVLLIVVGVVYVVVADSSFASLSSRNFPRETRVLLWLGYLIFVAAVANYVLVAREIEFRVEFDRYAFQLLALPVAAWLAVRSRITAPESPDPPSG